MIDLIRYYVKTHWLKRNISRPPSLPRFSSSCPVSLFAALPLLSHKGRPHRSGVFPSPPSQRIIRCTCIKMSLKHQPSDVKTANLSLHRAYESRASFTVTCFLPCVPLFSPPREYETPCPRNRSHLNRPEVKPWTRTRRRSACVAFKNRYNKELGQKTGLPVLRERTAGESSQHKAHAKVNQPHTCNTFKKH